MHNVPIRYIKMDENQDPRLTSRIRNSPVLDLSILQHSGNQETCARLYDVGESRARNCNLESRIADP